MGEWIIGINIMIGDYIGTTMRIHHLLSIREITFIQAELRVGCYGEGVIGEPILRGSLLAVGG